MIHNHLHPFLSRGLHSRLARLLLLGTAISLASCATPPPSLPDQSATPRRLNLAAGDVVKLSFPGNPDFNQTQKIRSDGKVNLPGVGEVVAAGKTVAQFQTELIRLFQPQLTNSDVIVTLESGAAQVYVTGAVAKPGKLAFDRPTTILQAIMEAGGPNEFGSLKKVRIVRLENGEQNTFSVDLRATMEGRATTPVYVKDGDVISISASSF